MQNPRINKTNNGFFEKVYRLVKQISKGKVATYGQIAKALKTRDARKVGWALHSNKSVNVPCHRVVNRKGALANNFGFGGLKEQARRLKAEGVRLKDKKVDLKKYQYKFQMTNS
jgi:methylated-DNA-protein-cysteine methyltransferase-like protein